MRSGWIAAGVAFALGAAIAILAFPSPPDEPVESASLDDGEAALTEVRATGVAERPTWVVGDAWALEFNAPDGLVCSTIVVEADPTGGYRLGYSCGKPDVDVVVATQVAGFGMFYVSAFSPELEGISGNGETRFFDWPLADGKTWETDWDGDAVEVAASYDGDGRFELTMRRGGEPFANYDYDPALRWWSGFEFATGYKIAIHEVGSKWRGSATSGIGAERFQITRTAIQQLPVRPSFEVLDEDEMLFVQITRVGTYVHRFQFIEPDGSTGWGGTSTSTSNIALSGDCNGSRCSTEFPGMPGIWSIDDQFLSGGEATYRVLGVDITVHDIGR